MATRKHSKFSWCLTLLVIFSSAIAIPVHPKGNPAESVTTLNFQSPNQLAFHPQTESTTTESDSQSFQLIHSTRHRSRPFLRRRVAQKENNKNDNQPVTTVPLVSSTRQTTTQSSQSTNSTTSPIPSSQPPASSTTPGNDSSSNEKSKNDKDNKNKTPIPSTPPSPVPKDPKQSGQDKSSGSTPSTTPAKSTPKSNSGTTSTDSNSSPDKNDSDGKHSRDKDNDTGGNSASTDPKFSPKILKSPPFLIGAGIIILIAAVAAYFSFKSGMCGRRQSVTEQPYESVEQDDIRPQRDGTGAQAIDGDGWNDGWDNDDWGPSDSRSKD